MDMREEHLSIQIGVRHRVAEGAAIRTERGSERTTRLRCHWRSFPQAAKARSKGVGIVTGSNRSDTEAEYDQDKERKFFHV
jgi:hypothetical protein